MNNTEETIKNLIRESLRKRIEGFGQIDNVLNNYELVESWLSDIMALGYNHSDMEAALGDINEMRLLLEGEQRFEQLRARLSLTMNRFPDEVMAFQTYAENRDMDEDESIIANVEEILSDVEPGDFMLF